MNIEMLRRVRDAIANHSSPFSMSQWGVEKTRQFAALTT